MGATVWEDLRAIAILGKNELEPGSIYVSEDCQLLLQLFGAKTSS